MLSQLVPYQFRKSKRAKRISLAALPTGVIEIILPMRVSESEGFAFFKHKQAWAKKHLSAPPKVPSKYLLQPQTLPNAFHFPCIKESYKVCYLKSAHKTVVISAPLPGVLIVSGTINHHALCQNKLNAWIKQKAHAHLVPLLEQLAAKMHLSYRHVTIRLQHTRWGSCSANKDISLNAKLLYLEMPVVRYVLIHELCHLKEFNHSQRFWNLVARYEPNYKQLKQQLD